LLFSADLSQCTFGRLVQIGVAGILLAYNHSIAFWRLLQAQSAVVSSSARGAAEQAEQQVEF